VQLLKLSSTPIIPTLDTVTRKHLAAEGIAEFIRLIDKSVSRVVPDGFGTNWIVPVPATIDIVLVCEDNEYKCIGVAELHDPLQQSVKS